MISKLVKYKHMKLTDEQKCAIEAEYKEWESLQYSGKDKKSRQRLGQFFTPPPLTIKMLEKFDTVKDKDILDPTSGAGGLLLHAYFAVQTLSESMALSLILRLRRSAGSV